MSSIGREQDKEYPIGRGKAHLLDNPLTLGHLGETLLNFLHVRTVRTVDEEHAFEAPTIVKPP